MTFRKKLMISTLASTLLGAAVIPTLAETPHRDDCDARRHGAGCNAGRRVGRLVP